MGRFRVRVCAGPTCGDKHGSKAIGAEFRRALDAAGMADVELCWQSCYGRCRKGPNVLVRQMVDRPTTYTFSVATPPAGGAGPATMYNYVTPEDVVDIVQEHLVTGRPVKALIRRARAREAAYESEVAQKDTGQMKKDGTLK